MPAFLNAGIDVSVGASLPAKNVNDNVAILVLSGVLRLFASKLAPT